MEKQSRILCFPFLGRLLLVVWQMRCAYEVKGNNLHLQITLLYPAKGTMERVKRQPGGSQLGWFYFILF